MIVFSASLPELGPVARLSGRGSAHSGTRWTGRICLFDKRAALPQAAGTSLGQLCSAQQRAQRGQVGIWRESR